MGNTKEAYTAGGMFDAMKKTADVGIFEFTGIETIEHTFYTSVPSVDNDVRKQYLEEVKDVVNRFNKNSGFNNRSFYFIINFGIYL